MKQEHFEQLCARYPGTSRVALPSGNALITVPSYPLPAGWNATSTSIRFVEPAQYPFACLDCFWADEGLRLTNGGTPQNAQVMAIPETGQSGYWFSWHIGASWNPNTHNMLSWMASVGDRLRKLQ